MSERPAATTANTLIRHAREATSIALSGLTVVTPITAAEALVSTPDSLAAPVGTPHEIAATSRLPHVQEYGKVVTQNPNGTAANALNQTFTVTETCKDGAEQVHRTVRLKAGVQEPLGHCNQGKSATFKQEQPATGNWHIQTSVKRILKVTRHNNRIIFTDIQEKNPAPQPAASSNPTGSSSSGADSSSNAGGSGSTGTGEGTGGGSGGSGGTGSGGSGEGGGGTGDPFAPGNIGADVGPYQCDGPDNTNTTIEGVLPENINFAMVDLGDGLGYSVNPCLQAEVSTLTTAGITVDYYMNTGWFSGSSHLDTTTPKVCAPGDSVCDAYDYGAGNVTYTVQAINSLGLTISGKRVFRDGETDNTWATNSDGQANAEQAAENESSLQGTHDALIDAGATDSLLYENPDFNNTVLDGLQTGAPIWLATGESSAAQAETSCDTTGPDGGLVTIVQYIGAMTNGTPLDMNIVCAVPAS